MLETDFKTIQKCVFIECCIKILLRQSSSHCSTSTNIKTLRRPPAQTNKNNYWQEGVFKSVECSQNCEHYSFNKLHIFLCIVLKMIFAAKIKLAKLQPIARRLKWLMKIKLFCPKLWLDVNLNAFMNYKVKNFGASPGRVDRRRSSDSR